MLNNSAPLRLDVSLRGLSFEIIILTNDVPMTGHRLKTTIRHSFNPRSLYFLGLSGLAFATLGALGAVTASSVELLTPFLTFLLLQGPNYLQSEILLVF